jgi:hypothetical protein
MKKTLLFLILIVFSSCKQDTKIIKGDLYFKLVNLTSPNGMATDEVHKIETMLDSSNSNLNDGEKAIIDYFEKLRAHKLLSSPYIKLRMSKDEVKTVFLSPKEHQKVKKYTLDYLRKNKAKLEIELKIKEIDSLIYYSDEIIHLNEVKGETYFEK